MKQSFDCPNPRVKQMRYLAACSVCYSGARLETNSKRAAEEHATHHIVMYGHDVTILDRHPTPRKEG